MTNPVWKNLLLVLYLPLILLGLVASSTPANAGMYAVDLSQVECRHIPHRMLEHLPEGWADYLPAAQACPIKTSRGDIVLWVVEVRTDQIDPPSELGVEIADGTADPPPPAVLFDKHARLIGTLPSDAGQTPAFPVGVSFQDWVYDFPERIVFGAPAGVPFQGDLSPLYWHWQTHSYSTNSRM